MGNKAEKIRGIALSFCPEAHSRLQCEGWSQARHTSFTLLRQEIKCQSGEFARQEYGEEESHREKYNSKLKIVNFLKAQKSP